MRLAMKFGVSFAGTTPLPRRWSAKSATACSTAGSVSGVRMISTSRRYRGGLKKCVPSACALKDGGPAFDDGRDRDARRVGADDRVRRPMPVDALEERLLDVEAFDDGLDDPVGRRDRGQVLVEAAGANERAPRPA